MDHFLAYEFDVESSSTLWTVSEELCQDKNCLLTPNNETLEAMHVPLFMKSLELSPCVALNERPGREDRRKRVLAPENYLLF